MTNIRHTKHNRYIYVWLTYIVCKYIFKKIKPKSFQALNRFVMWFLYSDATVQVCCGCHLFTRYSNSHFGSVPVSVWFYCSSSFFFIDIRWTDWGFGKCNEAKHDLEHVYIFEHELMQSNTSRTIEWNIYELCNCTMFFNVL